MRRFVLLAALVLPIQGHAQGRPRAFNIYASLADDAANGPAIQQVQGALRRCGINSTADGSMAYDGLTPGFTIVVSGPFRSRDAAAAELGRARVCGVEGYTRIAARRHGVLED